MFKRATYKDFQSITVEVTDEGRPLVPTESIAAITTMLSLEIEVKGEYRVQ